MNVRLTQIDGKLPNIALMKLAYFFRGDGHEVTLTRDLTRGLDEPDYDRVYGSTIFAFSDRRVAAFRDQFPGAVVHGTGVDGDSALFTVEKEIGVGDYEHYDYSDYPDYLPSIGYTARGCRMRCGFCGVPGKEGRPKSVNTVAELWRGEPWPKHLHLLDNDFFGQPRAQWEARCGEIIDGGFKVCFNQGINVRLIDPEVAEWLVRLPCRDDGFERRRLYTAWDNLKDEHLFFRKIDMLEKAGFPLTALWVYMLTGYDASETMERVLYRFNRMVERGIRPYPMVFDRSNRELCRFQRWAIRVSKLGVPWEEYDANAKGRAVDDEQLSLDGAA